MAESDSDVYIRGCLEASLEARQRLLRHRSLFPSDFEDETFPCLFKLLDILGRLTFMDSVDAIRVFLSSTKLKEITPDHRIALISKLDKIYSYQLTKACEELDCTGAGLSWLMGNISVLLSLIFDKALIYVTEGFVEELDEDKNEEVEEAEGDLEEEGVSYETISSTVRKLRMEYLTLVDGKEMKEKEEEDDDDEGRTEAGEVGDYLLEGAMAWGGAELGYVIMGAKIGGAGGMLIGVVMGAIGAFVGKRIGWKIYDVGGGIKSWLVGEDKKKGLAKLGGK